MVEHLEEVLSLLDAERREAPVVEDEPVHLRPTSEEAGERAVAAGPKSSRGSGSAPAASERAEPTLRTHRGRVFWTRRAGRFMERSLSGVGGHPKTRWGTRAWAAHQAAHLPNRLH
jgi:hypothetical protein